MESIIDDVETVIIKAGTGALTLDHRIDLQSIDNIAKAVVKLKEHGRRVAIVTSGAIAKGRIDLNYWGEADLATKQALSMAGQYKLVHAYDEAFRAHGLRGAGQGLIGRRELDDPKAVQNIVDAYHAALALGIVPVLNENDFATTKEIRLSDNDELQVLFGIAVHAKALINLTRSNGLIRQGHVVPYCTSYSHGHYDVINREEIEGRGGLKGKLKAAELANSKGMYFLIGNVRGDIIGMLKGTEEHSRFSPA